MHIVYNVNGSCAGTPAPTPTATATATERHGYGHSDRGDRHSNVEWDGDTDTNVRATDGRFRGHHDLGWSRLGSRPIIGAPLGSTNWFQGDISVFPALSEPDNSYIASDYNNTTGVGTISNWLLTPPLTLVNGAQMSFFTRKPSDVYLPGTPPRCG